MKPRMTIREMKQKKMHLKLNRDEERRLQRVLDYAVSTLLEMSTWGMPQTAVALCARLKNN